MFDPKNISFLKKEFIKDLDELKAKIQGVLDASLPNKQQHKAASEMATRAFWVTSEDMKTLLDCWLVWKPEKSDQ